MNTTSRHSNICSCFLAICFILLLVSTSFAVAKDTAANTEKNGQAAMQTPTKIRENTSTFEYLIEGRSDPFLPFLTERATTNENPNEIIDEDRVLSGMQLFEPGQLTLVALMIVGDDSFAMVQDFTGKGYVIKRGTKIGRRGVVTGIIENKVIIEETALTRSGKTLTNQIAMVLKKEGEE